MDEVRIVLLGKQGAGKSASGNTLLGQKLFHTAAHTDRVTQTCSAQTSTVDNQSITVVDTPGWPDSSSETEIKQEIMKCIDMCSPGPHVFLLVLPIGRFTYEEIKTIIDIMIEFGPEAYKHMLLLFTRGDDLAGKSIEDYLKNTQEDLKNILEMCSGYHVFNNRDKNKNIHNQVSSILQKINRMMARNCYTKTMYQNKDQRREQEAWRRKEENLTTSKYTTKYKNTETKTGKYSEMNEKREKQSQIREVGKQTDKEERDTETVMPMNKISSNDSKGAHRQDYYRMERTSVDRRGTEMIIELQKTNEDMKLKLENMTLHLERVERCLQEIKTMLSERLNQENKNKLNTKPTAPSSSDLISNLFRRHTF
ncbi:GTPase IMAP family member 4-like [Misgurnus anguillicaudatus]|uniref:GTPase IMAP family member 4-like n=1 Tax=Misgurnus anguillicaudatus TaxID=75329 RepID=UPI003CCF4934